MSKEQCDLREDFEKKRGYWHAFWEDFLRLSPEFFGAYVEYSSVPWTHEGVNGVLEPKVKELIYCAFDSAAPHLYTSLLSSHHLRFHHLLATAFLPIFSNGNINSTSRKLSNTCHNPVHHRAIIRTHHTLQAPKAVIARKINQVDDPTVDESRRTISFWILRLVLCTVVCLYLARATSHVRYCVP